MFLKQTIPWWSVLEFRLNWAVKTSTLDKITSEGIHFWWSILFGQVGNCYNLSMCLFFNGLGLLMLPFHYISWFTIIVYLSLSLSLSLLCFIFLCFWNDSYVYIKLSNCSLMISGVLPHWMDYVGIWWSLPPKEMAQTCLCNTLGVVVDGEGTLLISTKTVV
jgi:hypothetical protein